MKRTLLVAGVLALSTLSLNAANDGMKVYETHCKACHMLQPKMDKEKMKSMSMEERMAMKQKMMKMMKAPPMSKISAKLKYDFKGDKAQIVTFIKDYIVNPDAAKSKCMPMALKKFGVMPPIGKGMKAEDIDAVANWIVDNFNEIWDPKAMNMMCSTSMGKQKSAAMHKCGAAQVKANGGKCGSGMETKKIVSPKVEKQTMKCAAGKCGGK